MPKITVKEDCRIPDPRAGAYVKGSLLTAGTEMDFSKGTWDVSETVAAIWNGTYELPEGATDRRGNPLTKPKLVQEPTPPINPDAKLKE
ncbi:MAG: hypothetical protein KC729_00095 [Candidatus Eisenbacteria bacterium]|uniref:Uncharacterized protein n=1 Tax=Eiseniibacteriota bacterium TaxID=2212470 RepID=A0A956LXD5_UNCEI|nr:hypothetical protein [Candidatus Eisenbacteria bacterium]